MQSSSQIYAVSPSRRVSPLSRHIRLKVPDLTGVRVGEICGKLGTNCRTAFRRAWRGRGSAPEHPTKRPRRAPHGRCKAKTAQHPIAHFFSTADTCGAPSEQPRLETPGTAQGKYAASSMRFHQHFIGLHQAMGVRRPITIVPGRRLPPGESDEPCRSLSIKNLCRATS